MALSCGSGLSVVSTVKRVHVVAGVVLDATGERVLLAERKADQHQGGLWEYPGGKCEPGESDGVALARELEEEIGIVIASPTPLTVVEHDYPDKSVTLSFYVVTDFSGAPRGREGQRVQWVRVDALDDYAFPAANNPVASTLNTWLAARAR